MTWNDAQIGLARRRRSIRVVIGALSVLVLLVAALGTWQVLAARSSQRAQIVNGELTAARLAGKTVSNAVTSRLQLLDNLAGQPGTAAFVNQSPTQSLAPVLAELLRLYPQFSGMAIVNAAGALLAQAPPQASTPALANVREQSFQSVARGGRASVSGAFAEPSGGLAVMVSAPVRNDSGALVGLIQATVPVSSLSSSLGGTRLSGGGTIVLVDHTAHVLTGPAASTSASYRTNTAIANALKGKSGTGSEPVPGFVGSRLVAFAPVKGLGWGVIVENSQSALSGPVAAMTERLVVIGAAVVLFAVATALVLWLLLRQLGRQRDEVTAIFASVGEGLATVDADGQVLKVNPALEDLCGQGASDIQGKPWSQAFVIYDARGNTVPWDESVAAQAIHTRRVVVSQGFSLSLQTADGRRVPVAVTASPLFINRLVPSGAVVVVRDVSREREVDRLKSSLVSTVSHELRTPLTLIQGFSELLLTRPELDSTKAQAALTQIHASSQRLGRLIDDLLSVSRIESGRLSIEARPLDMAETVREVITSFDVESNHRFAMHVPDDLGPVEADRDKTLQVLTNLVSNAVKYSPPGSEIRISVQESGNHVEVQVTDEGIGMTPEEAAGVFEKFTRSDRPEVRNVGGTGLGLYITKSLVELQGGQLWVRSERGHGSAFTFTIPRERTAATARPEASPGSGTVAAGGGVGPSQPADLKTHEGFTEFSGSEAGGNGMGEDGGAAQSPQVPTQVATEATGASGTGGRARP